MQRSRHKILHTVAYKSQDVVFSPYGNAVFPSYRYTRKTVSRCFYVTIQVQDVEFSSHGNGRKCSISHFTTETQRAQRREDILPLSVKCRSFRSSRAETQRNSFFKPVDTSSNTGVHHRYHRPDSFSVILCASAPPRETCSTPIAESAGIPESLRFYMNMGA